MQLLSAKKTNRESAKTSSLHLFASGGKELLTILPGCLDQGATRSAFAQLTVLDCLSTMALLPEVANEVSISRISLLSC